MAYSTGTDGRLATFALSGRLFVCDVAAGATREIPVTGACVDPQLSPDGTAVAYLAGPALRVTRLDGRPVLDLADEDPEVSFGAAELGAAEEMDRHHGYWWSPDGTTLLAARVSEHDVASWWLGDPADAAAEPYRQRLPPAASDVGPRLRPGRCRDRRRGEPDGATRPDRRAYPSRHRRRRRLRPGRVATELRGRPAGRVLRGMLMRGFTSIRDVGGGDHGLARAVDEGYFDGPRMFYGGKQLSQTGGAGEWRAPSRVVYDRHYYTPAIGVICDGVAEVRRAVREEDHQGRPHHIKVYLSGAVDSPSDRVDSTQFSMEELVS